MPLQIVHLPETHLVGKHLLVSITNGRIQELWKSFMPIRPQIQHTTGKALYSIELYPDLAFFKMLDVERTFTRWAAVEVKEIQNLPKGLEALTIPAGRYAVFTYRGTEHQAQGVFQYIYGTWFPESAYELDHRPHFAKMEERYKGNDPDSEEEFWFPIL